MHLVILNRWSTILRVWGLQYPSYLHNRMVTRFQGLLYIVELCAANTHSILYTFSFLPNHVCYGYHGTTMRKQQSLRTSCIPVNKLILHKSDMLKSTRSVMRVCNISFDPVAFLYDCVYLLSFICCLVPQSN